MPTFANLSDPLSDFVFWGSIAVTCLLLVLFLLLIVSLLSRSRRRRQLSREIDAEMAATEPVTPPSAPTESAVIRNLGTTVIRRIDNIDDTISHFSESKASESVVRQLRALREDLMDLLRQNQIEPYRFTDGTEVDSTIRKLVQISESRPVAGREKAIVAETLCPGFRYTGVTPAEILRKTEVVVEESV